MSGIRRRGGDVVRVEVFRGRLKALTPVFHGGNEKTGSVQLLNRLKFIVNGKPTDVPIISGNSIRGRLRRLLVKDFLSLAGYQLDLTKTKHQRLYHTLYAGGVLTATSDKESGVVDLSLKTRIQSYILPVRLFGASYVNQTVEGEVLVGHLLPICRELSEYTGIDSSVSFYQLIGHTFQTRKDDLKVESEDEQAVQMIVEYEVFSAGTEFYHELVLETAEDKFDLDASTLYRSIELWKKAPFLGGKSSVGFGKLKIDYEFPKEVNSDRYLEFTQKNAEKIKEVLDELVEAL